MRNIFHIARKELSQYFISPVAYAFTFAILLVMGILFYTNMLYSFQQQYTPSIIDIAIGPLTTILLFTVSAFTMRTVADEQRTGTLELLLTAPVRDWEFIVGKWLGAVFFFLILLAITWIYPIILNNLVEPGIDQGLMISGYLGIFLLVASFLAIGVAVSSFFSNQIAAFFVTMGVVVLLWIIQAPESATSTTGGLLSYLSLSEHLDPFYQGVIELKNIVYYLSVIAFALFLGSLNIEMKRWR